MAQQIVGLLLAAGRGTRFDPSGATSKLLAPLPAALSTTAAVADNVAAEAARRLRLSVPTVIAVVRPADSSLQQALNEQLRRAGCVLVVNPRADEGMGSSIAIGVQASRAAAGWLVALADMPAIQPATLTAVRDALAAGAVTAAPVHQGRRGHPVGFAAPCGAELAALTGDEGARRVLAAHPPRLIEVDDPGCLLDLDTPADFVRR